MSKINVYVSDDLERDVRAAGLSISPICQAALREAVDRLSSIRGSGANKTPTPNLAAYVGRGRFTARLAAILANVEAGCSERRRKVTSLDLLGAIIEHSENIGARALAALGVDHPPPRSAVRARPRKGSGELDPDAREVLGTAFKIALEMRHNHVGTEHVVIALAQEDTPTKGLLTSLDVDAMRLRQQVERLLANPGTAERPHQGDSVRMLDRIDGELQRLAAEFDHLRGTLQDQAPSPPRPPVPLPPGATGE
jgi:ATP-dependent Clp protease ATP-binding subunit ClpC